MNALVAFPSVSKNELRIMRRQHASDSPRLFGAGMPDTSFRSDGLGHDENRQLLVRNNRPSSPRFQCL
jgi:hypothetical protein